MAVYILHYSGKLGNERHHANHYCGWAPDGAVDARIAEHRAGKGARIIQAAGSI